MEHYTLKIVIEDNTERDPTISEEAKSDRAVNEARNKANDILTGTYSNGNAASSSSALANKERGSMGAAIGGAAAYAGGQILGTAGRVVTKMATNYLTSQYAYTGNSALQNARTNTVSAATDIVSSVGDVASLTIAGATIGAAAGPWGALIGGAIGLVAGAIVECTEKVDSVNSQVLELRYQTETWRDESRKTSERLGFEATKRSRYTYEY